METTAKRRSSSGHTFILIGLYSLLFGLIIYFFMLGFSYYSTEIASRPRHPGYMLFKPGGIYGHGFGIAGTLMMILLLSYSLRKRTSLFGRVGHVSHWLNYHIFLGIGGPLFVILHSSFKLNGLISVSFWSMIAVALSGILGRYLYLQIPRNIEGFELSSAELKNINDRYSQQICQEFGLEEADVLRIQNMITGATDTNLSMLMMIVYLMGSDLLRFYKKIRVKQSLKRICGLSSADSANLVKIAFRKALLERRILLWSRVHTLFHYWHVFHKPFAIIMYLIMIVHVAITIWLGYTWIL